MRLTLFDGVTTANISTTLGNITIRSYTSSRYDLADVHVIEVNTTAGESDCQLEWVPELAISSWSNTVPNYTYNPLPVTISDGDAIVTTQTLLSGNSYATAYTQVRFEGKVNTCIHTVCARLLFLLLLFLFLFFIIFFCFP